MKHFKKTLRLLSISVVLVLSSLVFYACASIPKISHEEKQIINQVTKMPIPQIIKGKTGFATSKGHSIWYESINPKVENKGAVILIMGNGNDALTWPPALISNLVNQEYQVIRYDHRGTGLSTSKEKWKKKNAYSLNDMADDVIAILDTLKLGQAHIVGASMGGMIAQIVAIEYPNRTASLTSIMSTGDPMDPTLPQMSNDIIPQMVSAILKHGFLEIKKDKSNVKSFRKEF